MSTLYLTFRFLHVTSAIVWVGGVIALAVVNARLARAGEASASQAVARAGVFFGTAVMMPAAVVTLLAGFALLGVTGRGLQLWTVWGLAGVFGSILLGALVLRRAGQELSALSARPSPDTARIAVLRRRLTRGGLFNIVLLVSTVWAMVFKPTL